MLPNLDQKSRKFSLTILYGSSHFKAVSPVNWSSLLHISFYVLLILRKLALYALCWWRVRIAKRLENWLNGCMKVSSVERNQVTMKSWVDETTFTQSSSDVSSLSMNRMKSHNVDMSKILRKAKLEADLKQLEWHKSANDAALKVGRQWLLGFQLWWAMCNVLFNVLTPWRKLFLICVQCVQLTSISVIDVVVLQQHDVNFLSSYS